MSSLIWKPLYKLILQEARKMPRGSRTPVYSEALVVALFFWFVLHDRTQEWACERSSYHHLFRPRRLPSPSRFSRRLRAPSCLKLIERVWQATRGEPQAGWCYLDSRPLTVGACSKDPDAPAGRVYGGFARGYRLHVLTDEKRAVIAWKLTSMNTAEVAVAQELLPQAPPGSTTLADSNFDRAPLYETASAHGSTLLAKPRKGAGCGHRKQSLVRLASIARWNTDPNAYAVRRADVERAQAHQSTFAGGLQPLPTWVRRLPRVQRWVMAKLVIYHVKLSQKQRAA